MAAGVWDGIDKERVGRGLVTAFMSDEYLEALADINNAETEGEVLHARDKVKDLMVLWREEVPEYAFAVDALYLFSEKMLEMLRAMEEEDAPVVDSDS